MDNKSIKITSFTKLDAWSEGHKLVINIYLLNKNFPRDEVFGLSLQMKRCAVSITSNIAEGFSRQSYKEKIQFYSFALGSITELQNQLLIAKDVGYIDQQQFRGLADQAIKVHKIVNGLIRKSRSFIHNS